MYSYVMLLTHFSSFSILFLFTFLLLFYLIYLHLISLSKLILWVCTGNGVVVAQSETLADGRKPPA